MAKTVIDEGLKFFPNSVELNMNKGITFQALGEVA